MRASEVSGRAYNYRLIFNQTWDRIGERLLKAQTEEEVIQAFEETPINRSSRVWRRSSCGYCESRISPSGIVKLRPISWRIRWRREAKSVPALLVTSAKGSERSSVGNPLTASFATNTMWNARAAIKDRPATMLAANAALRFLARSG